MPLHNPKFREHFSVSHEIFHRLSKRFAAFKNDFSSVFRTLRVEEIGKRWRLQLKIIFVDTKKKMHILWHSLILLNDCKSRTRKPMQFAWIFTLCNIAGARNLTEWILFYFQHRELRTVYCTMHKSRQPADKVESCSLTVAYQLYLIS